MASEQSAHEVVGLTTMSIRRRFAAMALAAALVAACTPDDDLGSIGPGEGSIAESGVIVINTTGSNDEASRADAVGPVATVAEAPLADAETTTTIESAPRPRPGGTAPAVTETTSTTTSVPSTTTTATTSATTTSTPVSTTTTTSTPIATSTTTSSTLAPPMPADGYDDELAFLRGGIQIGGSDGTVDCFRESSQTQTAEGLRFVLAEPADAADVAVICLVTGEGAAVPSQVVVRDPLGRPWVASPLELGSSFELGANSGTTVDATVIDAVIARVLHPVGQTFVEGGQRYVALYVAIPTARPSGSWTVEFNDETASLAMTEPCAVTDEQVRVWPLDPDLVVVLDTPLAEVPQVENCRVAPDLSGSGHEPAVQAFVDAFAVLGFPDVGVEIDIECSSDPASGPFVVVGQSPAPGLALALDADAPAAPSIAVRGACPSMPNVIGLAVDQARAAILAVWPSGIEPDIAVAECVGGDDVVTQASPLPTDPPSATITLRCD